MKICEWCNEEFAIEDAGEIFEMEMWGLLYRNIRKCLCDKCAVKAIEGEVDGIYYEICEECGKEFDLMKESMEFDNYFSTCNGTRLRDYWNPSIVCFDCALKQIEEENNF